MLRRTTVIAVAFAVLAAVATASSQGQLAVSSAWVKAPAAGETTALAFATVDNPGMYDVFLTSATSDAAARVEFRDRTKGADASVQTVKFFTAPAYGSLSMDEKGDYLVLIDLKRPLTPGDEVLLTLIAEDGTKLPVAAAVRN